MLNPASGNELGQRIRRLREDRGWDQGELARRLKKAQSEVNRWEMGRVVPSYSTIVKIASALGVSASALQEGEQEDKVLDVWLQSALETVRLSGGTGDLGESERKLIQADILRGCIKLGKAEGREVAELERMLIGLGVAEPAAKVSQRFFDIEAEAALERARAAKELATAARIEAQTASRRQDATLVAPSEPTPKEQWVLDLEKGTRSGKSPLPESPPQTDTERAGDPSKADPLEL